MCWNYINLGNMITYELFINEITFQTVGNNMIQVDNLE